MSNIAKPEMMLWANRNAHCCMRKQAMSSWFSSVARWSNVWRHWPGPTDHTSTSQPWRTCQQNYTMTTVPNCHCIEMRLYVTNCIIPRSWFKCQKHDNFNQYCSKPAVINHIYVVKKRHKIMNKMKNKTLFLLQRYTLVTNCFPVHTAWSILK